MKGGPSNRESNPFAKAASQLIEDFMIAAKWSYGADAA